MIDPKCLLVFIFINAGPVPASKAGQSSRNRFGSGPGHKKYHPHNFILLRKTTYQTLLKTLPILQRLANGI
jgi:hypothetical protein